MIHRRLFLGGLLAGAAAPAIVRASSLMPVKALAPLTISLDFGTGDQTSIVQARPLFKGEIGRWNVVRIIQMIPARHATHANAEIDRGLPPGAGRLMSACTFVEPQQFRDSEFFQVSWSNPYL